MRVVQKHQAAGEPAPEKKEDKDDEEYVSSR